MGNVGPFFLPLRQTMKTLTIISVRKVVGLIPVGNPFFVCLILAYAREMQMLNIATVLWTES